jgi:signal peptidase I
MTDSPEEKPAAWKRLIFGTSPGTTFARTMVLAAVSVPVFRFVLLPVRIKGASMEPAYHDRNLSVINTLSFIFREPGRGDVVAIRTTGMRVLYLKRIIGLPGETVEFRSGTVFINKAPLEEPYVKSGCSWNMQPVTVEQGEYFVVGDNRSMDIGLHVFGIIDADRVTGKPLF